MKNDHSAIDFELGIVLYEISEYKIPYAITMLQKVLSALDEPILMGELETLKSNYNYTLQYILSQANDKNHEDIIKHMAQKLAAIAVKTNHQYILKTTKEFYATQSNKIHPNHSSIKQSFQFLLVLEQNLPAHEESTEALACSDILVDQLITQFEWEGKEEREFLVQSILASRSYNQELFITTIYVSNLLCFNPHYLNILFSFTKHQDNSLRAIVRFALLHCYFIWHRYMELFPELAKNYDAFFQAKDNNKCITTFIYIMIAHHASLHLSSIIRAYTSDVKDLNGNEINSKEVQRKFELLRKWTELGVDVNYTMFSPFKNFTYFRSFGNWLRPFHESHPQLAPIIEKLKQSSLYQIINSKKDFCDSDKVSFIYLISMMDLAVTETQLEMIKEQLLESPAPHKQESEMHAMMNLAANMYRVISLNTSITPKGNMEFPPIKYDLLPGHIKECIDDELSLSSLVNLSCNLEQYEIALGFIKRQIERDPTSAAHCKKMAFCARKMHDTSMAIEYYLRCDIISPNDEEVIQQLISCYGEKKEYKKQMNYIEKLAKITSHHSRVIYQKAHCLINLGLHEDALRFLYQLDFNGESTLQVKRGIAWCLFILKRHNQALKHYTELIHNETPAFYEDFLNLGHIHLVMGNFHEAVNNYKLFLSLFMNDSKNNESKAQRCFLADKSILIEQGVSRLDISTIYCYLWPEE